MNAEQITKDYPMEYLLHHPVWLVRLAEHLRRKKLASLIRNINHKELINCLVDLGCEQGHLFDDTKFFITNYIGVDVSEYALDKARERINDSGVTFLKGDITDLPLLCNTSNVTVLSNILEHIENPYKAFREAVRITKPGGKIVVIVPNESLIITLKKMLKRLGLLGNLEINTAGHLYISGKWFLEKIASRSRVKTISLFHYPFGLYVYGVFEK